MSGRTSVWREKKLEEDRRERDKKRSVKREEKRRRKICHVIANSGTRRPS